MQNLLERASNTVWDFQRAADLVVVAAMGPVKVWLLLLNQEEEESNTSVHKEMNGVTVMMMTMTMMQPI